MFLVLCNANDVPALWAYQQLEREMGEAIGVVTTEMLALALRWEHRITAQGVSTTITLGDGRILRSDDVSGTLNRITGVPSESFRAAPADREYAATEMHALFASWLHALPGPVLNRGTPAGLSGPAWRGRPEWMLLASRAGFSTAPLTWSDEEEIDRAPAATRSLLVIGASVIGAPPSLIAPALALSRGSGAAILGIELTAGGRFHGATTHPDFRIGGRAAIHALQVALRTEVAA